MICLRINIVVCLRRALRLAATLAALASASPAMSADTNAVSKTELATLGGGCFWCLEAMFKTLPGVKAVTNGYAGGKTANPTYKQVCDGDTGHAEVVQIAFDSGKISYANLIEAFWDAHDPTTLNRQGNDVGSQYRSIILYHSEAQRAVAEAARTAGGRFQNQVVTEILPLKQFWPAEEYHQDYFRKHPDQAYCTAVVQPKVKHFQEVLKGKSPSP
jgi:peptide-methionine (S)-S-oxide reductase